VRGQKGGSITVQGAQLVFRTQGRWRAVQNEATLNTTMSNALTGMVTITIEQRMKNTLNSPSTSRQDMHVHMPGC
jgi:hypothetical protein